MDKADLDSEILELKAAKNKISFDFISGKDYTKQPENLHIYNNKSEGIVDMFSAFGEANSSKQALPKSGKLIFSAGLNQ